MVHASGSTVLSSHPFSSMLLNTSSSACKAAASCFVSLVSRLYRNVVAASKAVEAESANESGWFK